MHGRLRLAALLVTPDELGAIRSAARGRGNRLEIDWMERPEDLEGFGPGTIDVVVAVHAPPVLDAMRWLPRPGRGGSAPVIILCEEGTTEQAIGELREAGAFAVVARGRTEELERVVSLGVDRWAAGQRRGEGMPTDLAGMADLMRTIGHNLRDVLGGISNAVEVISFQSEDGSLSLRRSIEFLDRQCRRMSDLLDDYGELSRLQPSEVETVCELAELGGVLDRAIDQAKLKRPDGDRPFHRTARSEPLWLTTDRRRLEQLARHALTYACRSYAGRAPIRIDCLVSDDQVRVVIESSAERRARSGSAGGGLDVDMDLFLAALLADRIGGRVRPGPPIVIELPRPGRIATGSGAPAGRPRGVDAAMGGRRHLLLVDDNPESVQALGLLIGRLGWNVRVTPDIAEALEMVRTFRPEVVLIDLHMPTMNGEVLARVIRRELGYETPLLIGMSGMADHPPADGPNLRSFDHFLTKPVRRDEIEALLPPMASGPGPAARN